MQKMCDLLGMCFNKKITPNISLAAFKERGINSNIDGWGIAYYPDDLVRLIKEPIEASESELLSIILEKNQIYSKIIIGHVRARCSKKNYNNTHPFMREAKGKEWTFAHNGSLQNLNPNSGKFIPLGETDSEQYFCLLLDWIEKLKFNCNSNEFFQELQSTMK